MTARPAVSPTAPSSAVPDLHARVGPVLRDLAFPALRWEAVTAGDLYGVDSVTRALLERLPERRYGSLPELLHVLAAVLSGHAVPASRQPAAGPAPTRTPPGRPQPAPARHAPVPAARTQRSRIAVPARVAVPSRAPARTPAPAGRPVPAA
jgi:hypothetical protein